MRKDTFEGFEAPLLVVTYEPICVGKATQRSSNLLVIPSLECVTCGLLRQCWDFENLTTRGNGGYVGGDAKTDVAELTQFVHDRVDLLCARPL